MFCSVGDSSLRFLSLFFSSPALPPLLVLLRIRRGFRGPTALRWHFGLRWRRQMQAGVCVFSFCGPCSFVLLFPNFFLAKATAVFSLFFGPGFIYGILPRCSFFIIRNFFIFASSACSFCFGVWFFFPACRTGGSISMAPPPGMYQRRSGTRPRDTPTGRRSLFPAQSLLRIFFATLLLACII